jgi:hypothetical protein
MDRVECRARGFRGGTPKVLVSLTLSGAVVNVFIDTKQQLDNFVAELVAAGKVAWPEPASNEAVVASAEETGLTETQSAESV